MVMEQKRSKNVTGRIQKAVRHDTGRFLTQMKTVLTVPIRRRLREKDF